MGDVHFTNRLSVPTLIALAGIWLSGARAASAQTTDYLYSGSETNVTLNPGIYVITAYGAPGGSNKINGPLAVAALAVAFIAPEVDLGAALAFFGAESVGLGIEVLWAVLTKLKWALPV